jgi:pyruvate/2-oxoglutarate dehydrogenase complex dihydrolipoamide acyltransferase (E2) component
MRMLLIAKSFDPEFRKFRQCFRKWADEVAGNERMKAAAMRVFNNTLLRAYNKWASILTAAQNLSLEISLSAKGETMRGKTKIPPLKVLVRQAKQDAPEQLVKALNMADVDGNTALHWAARKGLEEGVKCLLEANAEPDWANREGSTALHWAARKGAADAVRLLLAAGSDREAVTKWGSTPLQFAKVDEHWEVIELLAPPGKLKEEAARKGKAAKEARQKKAAAEKAAEEEKAARREASEAAIRQRNEKRRESQAAFAGGGGGGKMGQIPTAALVKGKPASPNPKPAAAAAATPGNGKTPVAKRTRGAGKEADDGGLGKMMAKASVPRGPKR